MERRHDHGASNPIFTATNEAFARDYWYIVAAIIALLALIRGINFVQNTIRCVNLGVGGLILNPPNIDLVLADFVDLEPLQLQIPRNHRTDSCKYGRH